MLSGEKDQVPETQALPGAKSNSPQGYINGNVPCWPKLINQNPASFGPIYPGYGFSLPNLCS